MTNETKMIDIEELDQEELWNVIKDAISKYIEERKKEPEQEEWPKVGDRYYCVNKLGVIVPPIYDDDSADRFNKVTNNIHRNKEQAIRHKEYITYPRVRARELVELCDGFDPCGNGIIELDFYGTPKVFIYVDKLPNGGLRFIDFDAAKRSLSKLGETLIKVALGVIVGDEAERIVREYVGRDE